MATMQSERRIREHPILGPLSSASEVVVSFDNEPVSAILGDTVASALLAAGHRVLRTMPKSNEPRGGFCMVGRCADCLMIVDGVPSILACQTMAVSGMSVRTQHGLGDWNGKDSE